MKITFCGATGEVTGSAHLIELDNGFSILLDCGLYQGNEKSMASFNEIWPFEPSSVDCLILSHAHIDHSGRIPKLVKDGFNGPIYATHATRSLCALMLLDSAYIQERDAEYDNKRIKKLRRKRKSIKLKQPLYLKTDIPKTIDLFTTISYNHSIAIHPDVQLEFRDAGHILGSASVNLKIKENGQTTKIAFTGDVGRPDRPILRDPRPMEPSDIVISESTYGNRFHEGKPQEAERLLKILKRTCLEKKGKLIIPAFSVGRTQEIIYMLDQLETAGLLPILPVYVDSPLAVNATTIFGAHPECYDNQLNEYLLIDDNPFGFNMLTYIRDTEESKALNVSEEPCIIISSSGMMNAGRVKHHLYHNIDQEKNTFLIVGYCSPGTPGGMLRANAAALKLFGHWKIVKANVEVMDSFSAHADQKELRQFLANQKNSARKVFLVHGNSDAQNVFSEKLQEDGFNDVIIPEYRVSYDI